MTVQPLFLYASQTGVSQSIAEQLFEDATARNLKPRLLPLNSDTVQVLNKEKVVIIVCSSTGDGDPPDTCSKAWRFLRRQKTNLLEGVLYTILGRQKRRKELLFTSR